MLQHNWFKLQDYFQTDQFNYYRQHADTSIKRIAIMYMPQNQEQGAALNFHLSAREKRDISQSFNNEINKQSLQEVVALLKGLNKIEGPDKINLIKK